jgi:propanediol dehydratase large subunit
VIVLSDLSVPVVAEAFSAPGYGVTSFSLAHVLVLVVVNRERLFECLVRVAGAPVRLCALLEASDVIDMMYVIQEMRTERNWNFTTEPSSQILLHPQQTNTASPIRSNSSAAHAYSLQSTAHSL